MLRTIQGEYCVEPWKRRTEQRWSLARLEVKQTPHEGRTTILRNPKLIGATSSPFKYIYFSKITNIYLPIWNDPTISVARDKSPQSRGSCEIYRGVLGRNR